MICKSIKPICFAFLSGACKCVEVNVIFALNGTGGAGLTNEQACGAGVSAAAPVRNQHLIDASALQHSNPRLYFWLRGINVGSSIHDLGRLKTLLRRPPTLSQRTGIPQKKLEEIGKW